MARYYDELMNAEKYKDWLNLLRKVIKRYKVESGLALDVACGTGEMSNLVSKEGFKVIGIDKSEEMLKVAKEKYPSLEFVKADMCDFNLKHKGIILAFSFYDSLNYLLTKEDLLKALRSVSENVAPSGLFVFDINSLEKIKNMQRKPPQVMDKENYYCIFRHGGKKCLWVLDMDFFLKKNGDYVLKRERHVERGYMEEEIKKLLRKTDLDLLEVKKEIKENFLSRLYFITRKSS